MAERTINSDSQRLDPNQGLVVHSKFQFLLRAIWLAGCAGIVLVLLSGCTAQAINQAENTLAARRAESLKGWETATLDGRPMLDTLQLRTASVWRDYDSVSAKFDDSGLSVEGTEGKGVAAAVAISKDGYLLTARHVVAAYEKLDVVVVYPKDGGGAQAKAVPARVVWKSDDNFPSDWNLDNPKFVLDLAILHVDVAPLAPFKLAVDLPRIDEPIISAGWGVAQNEDYENAAELAAGRVLSVHEQDSRGSSPAWVAVLHDIPIVRGDSGGPVLDRKGSLVGIHSKVRLRPSILRGLAMRLGRAPREFEDLGFTAMSIMPDSSWLWKIVDQDRLQRHGGSATPVPQSPEGLH